VWTTAAPRIIIASEFFSKVKFKHSKYAHTGAAAEFQFKVLKAKARDERKGSHPDSYLHRPTN
jgi:hypothetical protein